MPRKSRGAFEIRKATSTFVNLFTKYLKTLQFNVGLMMKPKGIPP